MPMITVQYATPQPKAGLADAIAQAASKLSADLLRNDPAVTAVVVEEIRPENWFVGGKSLAQHRLAGFWLDIRATEGTKTREEKAAFVAAAFAKMGALLGPLHSESYVYVNEARGDGYGYGGLTQNERYIAGKLKRAA